ncbi:MAG: VacJ family lipoprotein [Desulfocapsaceae bacterium]|nr:VacJ family lipoprotein [Desulfocapsaceae bacterium]
MTFFAIISKSSFIKRVIILLLIILLSSCASTDQTVDSLEPFNRKVQTFNDTVDKYAVKPVAQGYAYVTPEFFRKGLRNVFDNLGDINVFINQFLQGKVDKGLSDMFRFITNSTLGIAGLFDVATGVGLVAHDEDFGQTFAVWGFGSGPYVVLPFLGPATVRDGIGLVPGYFTNPVNYIEDDTARWSILGAGIIVERERLLASEELIIGDRYLFLRDAYLQRRQFLINDGEVEEDPFLVE